MLSSRGLQASSNPIPRQDRQAPSPLRRCLLPEKLHQRQVDSLQHLQQLQDQLNQHQHVRPSLNNVETMVK